MTLACPPGGLASGRWPGSRVIGHPQTVPEIRRVREAMTTEQLSSARLRLVPVTMAGAGEMVHVLSGTALYAFTSGSPPGTLRAEVIRSLSGA